MTARDSMCRQAQSARDVWVAGRSSVSPVGKSVLVGDVLGGRVDDPCDSVGELSNSKSERGETGGCFCEFGLSESGCVCRLQGMPLGVHEQVDAAAGVVGGSHAAEPTDDCAECVAVRGRWAVAS